MAGCLDPMTFREHNISSTGSAVLAKQSEAVPETREEDGFWWLRDGCF